MGETMEFINAKIEHLNKIWEITLEAKAQLKRMELDQWQKGYPEKENWLADIESRTAYIAVENGKILGAFMLLTQNEPSYDIINGKWLSNSPYASLHRVCVSDSAKGRGVAGKMFAEGCRLAKEKGLDSMRIDTHPGNKPMLRAIEKFGFTKCGTICIVGSSEDGDERVAFEKLI